MNEEYWNTRLEHLKTTRELYFNEDYLEFLVKSVWKINKPVSIIDFGCGYGYLGLKLLPYLPKGSKYTGIDQAERLIEAAKSIFLDLPYETEFFVADITNLEIQNKFDISICHAVLLHVPNPKVILKKMMDATLNRGKIICLEPQKISNLSSYHLGGAKQSDIISLDLIQRIYEKDAEEGNIDRNIGVKVPIFLSELGVKNIECRTSDKVNFYHPNLDIDERNRLFNALTVEGLGEVIPDKDLYTVELLKKGLTPEEIKKIYELDLLFSKKFNKDSIFINSPNIKIVYGDIFK
ncbi:class I SAM-dependent methyltransferase [Lysinibacillus sp. FSL M8-0134]|uniref:class I SAM-dependent methyltransferase n=1 Tax=Lysinibacillus sp. FSL M8-0134 TaxID=2921717 RepID=UPI00311A5CCC